MQRFALSPLSLSLVECCERDCRSERLALEPLRVRGRKVAREILSVDVLPLCLAPVYSPGSGVLIEHRLVHTVIGSLRSDVSGARQCVRCCSVCDAHLKSAETRKIAIRDAKT